ncbi:MAG TPA: NAD(P)-binding protein, partial [Micromonosporaceae bacterium]
LHPVQDENLRARADGQAGGYQRHFVVCGDNPLAYRLVDELVHQYDAHVTVILASVRENWAPKICEVAGVTVVESDRLDADAFTRADLAHAAALAIVEQEDAGNVDAALIAQELNPDVRIVIRMFNLRLGDRMSTLLNNCVVLSAAAIAAPAFVAAALDEATSPRIQVGDRTLVATPRTHAKPADIVCGLAVTAGRREPETLPPVHQEGRTDLVLAQTQPAAPATRRRQRRAMHLLPLLIGIRVRIALAILVGLFATGTAVLAWVRDIPWSSAAYTALLTELGGADADPSAPGLEKVTLVVLTLVSIALIPALTAAVVDGVVQARLRIEAGGLVERIEGHMVVVGLGDVGTRVIRALNEAGVDVVAIERNPQARGVQVARDLGIPVIIGNASRAEVLHASSLPTCRALVVASTDDVTNLETALLARSEKPDLRVVLRLFDGDFADRVQRAFMINTSRSVSYLAAPAFAAAMLGRQVIATIPVGRRVLLLAELPICPGAEFDGVRPDAINLPHKARLFAIRRGEQAQVDWRISDDAPLHQGDHLLVVVTRAGLSQLLAATSEPVPTGAIGGYRQREPGPTPHPRSATTIEGANTHPPFGSAELGSTGPA